MSHRFTHWRPTSPNQWSLLFAGLFGVLNIAFILAADSSYSSSFAVLGYIVTSTTTLLFWLFWLKMIETPNRVGYLRGGLVGLLAPLTGYVSLSIVLLPFSLFGIIGLIILWLTALYTVPIAILVSVVAIAIRKRS